MPAEPLPNNPYARPINATRPEGQMLQGEYYGERAHDKQLAGHGGRKVSPANRYAGRAIAVPVDMDALPTRRSAVRKRKVTTPSPEPTTPTADATSPSDEQSPITEDDLFG